MLGPSTRASHIPGLLQSSPRLRIGSTAYTTCAGAQQPQRRARLKAAAPADRGPTGLTDAELHGLFARIGHTNYPAWQLRHEGFRPQARPEAGLPDRPM